MSASTRLVTGAAALIGSNLSAHLLAQGQQVVGFDDMSTGTEANLARMEASGSEHFRLLRVVIRDGAAIAAVTAVVEAVVHLAA